MIQYLPLMSFFSAPYCRKESVRRDDFRDIFTDCCLEIEQRRLLLEGYSFCCTAMHTPGWILFLKHFNAVLKMSEIENPASIISVLCILICMCSMTARDSLCLNRCMQPRPCTATCRHRFSVKSK